MQYVQVNMLTLPWLLLLCLMRVHFSVLHQEVIALNEIVLYRGRGRGRGRGTGGRDEGRGEGEGVKVEGKRRRG